MPRKTTKTCLCIKADQNLKSISSLIWPVSFIGLGTICFLLTTSVFCGVANADNFYKTKDKLPPSQQDFHPQTDLSGDDDPDKTIPFSTSSLLGPLGLNTVSSARFDDVGTISLTTSTSDPYAHLILGTQLTKRVFIGLRQTSEISSIESLSDQLYPGMDFKLKLLDETRYKPALAVGIQSAFGHNRMAGEYLVGSKRFKNLDLSAGMAWGRLGSAAHMRNPLGLIAGHFDQRRALDGENPNNPGDWFVGQDIGFFAGLSYHIPKYNINFKLDWGADRYIRELATIEGFESPDPWSISLDYQPLEGINTNIGLVGGEKLMAQMTLKSNVLNWKSHSIDKQKTFPVYPFRSGQFSSNALMIGLDSQNIRTTYPEHDEHNIDLFLDITPFSSTPQLFGHTLRQTALYGGETIETISLTPFSSGLSGQTFQFVRDDVHKSFSNPQGSPAELWDNLKIKPAVHLNHTRFPGHFDVGDVKLQTETSLAEEDSSIITRTSLLYGTENRIYRNFYLGLLSRLKLADNFQRLEEIAQINPDDPVRSDIADFADQTVGFDKLYFAHIATPYTDFHTGIAAGYLDEIYSGITSEVLYRPFQKTWSLGAELSYLRRRNPDSTFNFDVTSTHVTTAHIKASYDIPNTNITVDASVGRYLAGDWGGSVGLTHYASNGVQLNGFITVTNETDNDIFGGESNYYGGLQIIMPLGEMAWLPDNTSLESIFAPIGRDKGQKLQSPLSLFQRSEPLSYRHIRNNWDHIIE